MSLISNKDSDVSRNVKEDVSKNGCERYLNQTAMIEIVFEKCFFFFFLKRAEG